jgi:hypothetical protein
MPLVLANKTEELIPLSAITDGFHPRWIDGLAPYDLYISDMLVHWLRSAMANPRALATKVDPSLAPNCER